MLLSIFFCCVKWKVASLVKKSLLLGPNIIDESIFSYNFDGIKDSASLLGDCDSALDCSRGKTFLTNHFLY
jgi:hypothetical protein